MYLLVNHIYTQNKRGHGAQGKEDSPASPSSPSYTPPSSSVRSTQVSYRDIQSPPSRTDAPALPSQGSSSIEQNPQEEVALRGWYH